MASGDLTLTISGLSSLVIRPNNNSMRTSPNRIKLGEETARGTTTLEGVTARPGLYTWRVEATVPYYQLLLFDEIRETQQSRFQSALSSGIVTAKDETWYVSSLARSLNGRSIVSGSSISQGGASASYCSFNVALEVGEDYFQLLHKRGGDLYDEVFFKFAMREI